MNLLTRRPAKVHRTSNEEHAERVRDKVLAGKLTTAQYIGNAIANSGKTHRAIAEDAGYGDRSIISMLKAGRERISINRIPALALALGVDQYEFLNIAMSEYAPDLWGIIQEYINRSYSPSAQKTLGIIAEVADGAPIAPETAEEIDALRKLAMRWKKRYHQQGLQAIEGESK